MRVAALRPQSGMTTSANAALRRAEQQTAGPQPRITEDVYSGPQDSESLWMASAWHGNGNASSSDQPTSTAAPSVQTAEPNSAQPSPVDSIPQLPPTTGARISYWA